MNIFLKPLFIAAIAIAPMSAHAGGLAPAVEAEPIVIAEAPPAPASSASNLVVPLLILGLVGLAAASGSGGGSSDGGGAKGVITDQ